MGAPLSFRRRLKLLRRTRKLTQEHLAQRMGVTVSTVNRWERGHHVPSPLALQALAALERENNDG